jgi:hypothetical protein
MSRALKNVLCAAALVGGTMFITNHVVSQQSQGTADDMMTKMMELGKPGPQHKRMQGDVGKWKQKNTYWEYPGAEPQVFETEADVKSVMGGRFLVSETSGKFPMGDREMDFEAMGIYGYDNMSKKYFFSWIDNFGTWMMTAYGTASDDGNVITYMSKMPDPMNGGEMDYKSVMTHVNKDHYTFEMSMKLPNGTWFKNMMVEGKRR